MTTAAQDRRFLDEIVGTGLLENAIEWIKDNLEPDEVFDEKDLDRWAQENNYQQIPDSE